jgi:hypothetical protein
MREWQKSLMFDTETLLIFDSLEKENRGRPTELANMDSLAAQISGVGMHRLCVEVRTLERHMKAANRSILLGVSNRADRLLFKQMFEFIDKFGLGFDDQPKSGKGFQFWIQSPTRFQSWKESVAAGLTGNTHVALSDTEFEGLVRDGVDLENLGKLVSGAKVLRLFQAARDLEYTRTFMGLYWKWMTSDLHYAKDQDAELKALCGLKLNSQRKQSKDNIVFDLSDPDRLRSWVAQAD